MKAKLAFFWALASIPAFSNPAKPAENLSPEAPAVKTPSCRENALSMLESIPSETEAIETFVTDAVTRFPTCSCEIVKAVIEKTKAEPKVVGLIVKAAIVAAPEHMRLTAQCAIAVAPDALAEVQSVFAALEANAGESGRSAKSGKEVVSSKDAKGGTPEPQASPKNDYLMTPAYLPIGVPGGVLISNPASEDDIPEVTPVNPRIKP